MKAEDAPKSFADLLDPKWVGKIVKAHPGYSGTIMTATFQIARDLGWDYFEKLAKQKVMQVQSSTDPPKKLALGERAVMADGNEYNLFQLKEKGEPVEIVYPTEGTPLIIGPIGVMKNAPNPERGAAVPELHVHAGGPAADRRRRRPALGPSRWSRRRPGRRPLTDIKLMKDDPAAVEKQAEEIKARYTQILQGLTHGTVAGRRAIRRDCRRTAATTRHAAPSRHRRRRFDLVAAASCWPFAALLCVLIVLPIGWLVVYSLHRPRRQPHARELSHARSPIRPSSSRCITTLIIAVSVSAALLPRSPRRWAGWWRAPTCRCAAPCASLVMASFVTPPFLGAIAWELLAAPNSGLLNQLYRVAHRRRPDEAPVQHLLAAGPDLRHLLLHLPLRLRAGRQRARPHPRRARGCLRRSSAAAPGARRGASPSRWRCRRCSPARWSPSCRR